MQVRLVLPSGDLAKSSNASTDSLTYILLVVVVVNGETLFLLENVSRAESIMIRAASTLLAAFLHTAFPILYIGHQNL